MHLTNGIDLSIRSTNVYEEQSLGIFPEDDEPDEEDFEPTGPRMTVWSRYLAMHARKQLAFGTLHVSTVLRVAQRVIQICGGLVWPYSYCASTRYGIIFLMSNSSFLPRTQRHNLDDPVSAIWFNIFSVGKLLLSVFHKCDTDNRLVFDLVSAYGTVGLSLGVPYVSQLLHF